MCIIFNWTVHTITNTVLTDYLNGTRLKTILHIFQEKLTQKDCPVTNHKVENYSWRQQHVGTSHIIITQGYITINKTILNYL